MSPLPTFPCEYVTKEEDREQIICRNIVRSIVNHALRTIVTTRLAHRTNRGHPRDCHSRRLATATVCRQPEPPAACAGTPLTRSAAEIKALFKEFSDIISQGEDDLGCTPLLQHTIETEGPPLHQPYRRQNPAVHREEMAQVQQMLSSGIIRPSNSPWASPVVMVKKKDSSLRFCVAFRQLNAATIKNAHPFPASTISSTLYMVLAGSPPLT